MQELCTRRVHSVKVLSALLLSALAAIVAPDLASRADIRAFKRPGTSSTDALCQVLACMFAVELQC